MNFKDGTYDRYDDSKPAIRVCVPGIGVDPDTPLYKLAFCWNTNCPIISSLAGRPLRIYIANAPVVPATGPDRLADSAVVFTHLKPQCTNVTSIATLANNLGTYK